MYLNIGRESGLSCTDTDDVFCQKPIDASEYNSTDDNVYCNIVLKDPPEVKLLINVNELRDYIKKRELNEGLKNEYKVCYKFGYNFIEKIRTNIMLVT